VIDVRQKSFLLIVLAVLLALMVFLAYMYVNLVRKPIIVTGPANVQMKHLFSIYGYGKEPSQLLTKPNDVAVDKKGNLYVADTGNSRIVVFDKEGNFLFRFGKKGRGRGEIESPLGIEISSNGRIYIADRTLNKVLILDAKGKFIKEFKVMMPLALTIANHKMFVATYGPIMVYDLEGNELAKWGRQGRRKGEFDFPGGIAVDQKENVYVSDTNNLRLQALGFGVAGKGYYGARKTLWITSWPGCR
jgi:DNA-binding beta-propeller fold protein YncE